MDNINKEPFHASLDNGEESQDPWDIVANYSESKIASDYLESQSIKYFGAEIETEESDLTPPMIPGPNGSKVPFRGRAFKSEQVPLVPVERSNGDIDHWMALGLTEVSVTNPQTGKAEVVGALIVGDVRDDGARMAKIISLSKHQETVNRMKPQRGAVEDTSQAVEEQLINSENSIDLNSPEGLLLGLTDADKKAVMSFAYHAANKRDAQRSNNGLESNDRSMWMGQELKKMSKAAKAVAAKYASRLYGDENVAF